MMPAHDGGMEQELLAVARAMATAAGMGFAPGCWAGVESVVRTGVQRMISEGRLEDRESIKLARRNVAALVEQMIAEARALGLPEMHENTLVAALAALCPIWPFC
jgi:hypothetical protein